MVRKVSWNPLNFAMQLRVRRFIIQCFGKVSRKIELPTSDDIFEQKSELLECNPIFPV